MLWFAWRKYPGKTRCDTDVLLKKQKQTPLTMHTPEMRGKERAAFLSRAMEKQAAVHSISIFVAKFCIV